MSLKNRSQVVNNVVKFSQLLRCFVAYGDISSAHEYQWVLDIRQCSQVNALTDTVASLLNSFRFLRVSIVALRCFRNVLIPSYRLHDGLL